MLTERSSAEGQVYVRSGSRLPVSIDSRSNDLMSLHKPAVYFLGRYSFRPIPAAILTSRGTLRTRKQPGKWGQRYQPGGPAVWLEWGFITVGLHCIAGDCGHYAQVRLVDLPQDQTWAQIGRQLLCSACGEIGSVNIEPHWHTRVKRFQG